MLPHRSSTSVLPYCATVELCGHRICIRSARGAICTWWRGNGHKPATNSEDKRQEKKMRCEVQKCFLTLLILCGEKGIRLLRTVSCSTTQPDGCAFRKAKVQIHWSIQGTLEARASLAPKIFLKIIQILGNFQGKPLF